MHKEIIILVGNIGAGKSTLTKKYQKEGYVVISRDSLRYGIGGGIYTFVDEYEPIIRQIEMFMLNRFLEYGDNIIVDEIGISKTLRKKYIDEAKKYDYKIICIELPKLSKEESVNRRLKDPHGDPDKELWEGVWENFDEMYEEPEYNEGFHEIIKLGSKNYEILTEIEEVFCVSCKGKGYLPNFNENSLQEDWYCPDCKGTGKYQREVHRLIATQPNGQRIAFNIDQENK